MSLEVSVIMSVFNAAPFLNDSIQSILSQTYSEFELIIINDASTDNSKELVLKFLEKDSRIRYFENATNLGVSESSNLAIREARGIFVAKQDADDISLPNRLESQLAFFKSHPDIDLLTGRALFFNERTGKEWLSGEELDHEEIKFRLLFTCPIMNPTLMVRKSFLIDNKLFYNPKFQVAEDYDLFCRSSTLGTLHSFREIIIKYRVHESINRLNHSSRKDIYKIGTSEIRRDLYKTRRVLMHEALLKHYEALFYSDVKINHWSCLKTVLFYRLIHRYLAGHLINRYYKDRFSVYLSSIFYNAFYQYSKVGPSAFLIYLKYCRTQLKMTPKQEFKFLVKSFLRK